MRDSWVMDRFSKSFFLFFFICLFFIGDQNTERISCMCKYCRVFPRLDNCTSPHLYPPLLQPICICWVWLTNILYTCMFRLLQMIALIHCALDTGPVWLDNAIARPVGRVRIAERLISRYTNACQDVRSMAPMTWRRDNASASDTGRDRIVRKVSFAQFKVHSLQFSVFAVYLLHHFLKHL